MENEPLKRGLTYNQDKLSNKNQHTERDLSTNRLFTFKNILIKQEYEEKKEPKYEILNLTHCNHQSTNRVEDEAKVITDPEELINGSEST